MVKVQTLLNFLNKAFVKRLVYLLLLISIIPLIDYFLVLQLGGLADTNLLTAGIAALSLFGFFFSIPRLMTMVQDILDHIRYGRYPDDPFRILIGGIVAAMFLIIPGPLTFLIGLILMLRFFRLRIGRIIMKGSEEQLRKMYEYIKLYEN